MLLKFVDVEPGMKKPRGIRVPKIVDSGPLGQAFCLGLHDGPVPYTPGAPVIDVTARCVQEDRTARFSCGHDQWPHSSKT